MAVMSPLLREIEKMVDALDASDRVRLQQYLAPRTTAISESSTPTPEDPKTAWQRFRAVGERLASTSGTGGSITEAVSEMRR
jgi:hypothetical protein